MYTRTHVHIMHTYTHTHVCVCARAHYYCRYDYNLPIASSRPDFTFFFYLRGRNNDGLKSDHFCGRYGRAQRDEIQFWSSSRHLSIFCAKRRFVVRFLAIVMCCPFFDLWLQIRRWCIAFNEVLLRNCDLTQLPSRDVRKVRVAMCLLHMLLWKNKLLEALMFLQFPRCFIHVPLFGYLISAKVEDYNRACSLS